MPLNISLESVPNQEFVITLADNDYKIRIFSISGGMSYDLTLNDKVVIQGFAMVNGVMFLPYKYQELSGNLLLVVHDDELPDYRNFGSTQNLIFMDELEADLYRNRLDDI